MNEFLDISTYDPKAPDFKSLNHNHDKLYGLPRKVLGLKDSFSYLPIGGFNNLFLNLHKQLINSDIRIKFLANLTPIFEGNRFILKVKCS